MDAISLGRAGRAGTMSVAVMNWIWAYSPTSGNEHLVRLALPALAHATTAQAAGC